MRRLRHLIGVLTLAVALLGPTVGDALAQDRFKIAWSIYVGWMPWGWAADHGIVEKWAKKYGIEIEVVQINDYVESINQYTAGGFDGCVMTNMDALTIPAVGGVDSTALIVGDFSNGNDGIVSKTAKDVKELAGQSLNLVELSVSHYLLARALESVGLSEKDVTVVNTSDADIVSVFTGTADVQHVVTWNPLLSEVAAFPGAHELFNSSQIPGEIIDLMVVNTKTLADNPAFGKALAGAWYETMTLMRGTDAEAVAARTEMAKASGTDLAGFDAQLKTTRMFWEPKDAVAFATSPKLAETMDHVRRFSHAKGLMGGNDLDPVGIAFPGGQVLGKPAGVKLRFSEAYMQQAAEGGL
jgi:NitT/TauT family transport system substrate-binding protein